MGDAWPILTADTCKKSENNFWFEGLSRRACLGGDKVFVRGPNPRSGACISSKRYGGKIGKQLVNSGRDSCDIRASPIL